VGCYEKGKTKEMISVKRPNIPQGPRGDVNEKKSDEGKKKKRGEKEAVVCTAGKRALWHKTHRFHKNFCNRRKGRDKKKTNAAS